jgi:hypothetical protein
MKILKSGVEMTPDELSASKAGKACACSCQLGFDTENMHLIGAEATTCVCGCIEPPGNYSSSGVWAYEYPY